MGSAAHERAVEVAYHSGDCILEIGAERGEGSTAFLADVARVEGIPFFSIDPDIRRCENYPVNGTLIVGCAEDVLTRWASSHPRFVWADGADWPYSWHMRDAGLMKEFGDLYGTWGATMTRQSSAHAHFVAAVELHKLCDQRGDTIIFDDTWFDIPLNEWRGKGMTAVPWLLRHGWWMPECTRGDEPYDGFVHLVRS